MMTIDERKAHASRLLQEVISNPDFGYLYEDDILADETEEDLRKIHVLMCEATATFEWRGVEDAS